MIDRFQLSKAAASSANYSSASHDVAADDDAGFTSTSPKAAKLRALVRALSVTSNARPLVGRSRLLSILRSTRSLQSEQAIEDFEEKSSEDETENTEVSDLRWLVVGKAAVQTYGLLLDSFFDQTIPLSDDIWYWDEVLGSYAYTVLYALQTAPLRIFQQIKDTLQDVKEFYASESEISVTRNVSDQWSHFYSLVQQSVRERSLVTARTTLLSPFALRRSEIRLKQKGLRKMRELNASGLGLLVNEAFSFDSEYDEAAATRDMYPSNQEEWKNTIAKTISLMEHVLGNVNSLDIAVADFEDSVFTSVENESEVSANYYHRNSHKDLIDRLEQVLERHLPAQRDSAAALVQENGRPSRLIRYWIPTVAALFSGGTILRILVNRKAEIITWIREFGATVIDFWHNWVVEPTKKLIGTIRHDEASEVAIMSKSSLEADRASLERMVVEFAADHPDGASGKSWTEAELNDIKVKVQEGDLTPVLKAYERDLQSPFVGAIRGDLVRALLIQIQKTKVDVEVAMRGIDNLLKSQELVFG